MKSSTKLISTAAASILGVAVAGGAAYAATGSLNVSDAPGQVLKVSGVGPASAQASETATTNADANAEGLFGSDVSTDAEASAGAEATVDPTAIPVEPRVAAESASTVKGSETGESVSTWSRTKGDVEVVDPAAAVSVDASVGVDASTNGRG